MEQYLKAIIESRKAILRYHTELCEENDKLLGLAPGGISRSEIVKALILREQALIDLDEAELKLFERQNRKQA